MKRRWLWSLGIVCVPVWLTLGGLSARQLRGQDPAPPTESVSYVYRLDLAGTPMAEYTECSGLGSSHTILENSIVDDCGMSVIQKTPGVLEWQNITLRQTGPSDADVWAWRQALETGNLDEAFRDGAIVMLTAGPPSQWIAEWTFRHGWAASLTLDGDVETLVIVHDGLQRVTPDGSTRP